MKINPTFSPTSNLNLTREESEHRFNNFSTVFLRKRGVSHIGIILLEILKGMITCIISLELCDIYPHLKKKKKNQG